MFNTSQKPTVLVNNPGFDDFTKTDLQSRTVSGTQLVLNKYLLSEQMGK